MHLWILLSEILINSSLLYPFLFTTYLCFRRSVVQVFRLAKVFFHSSNYVLIFKKKQLPPPTIRSYLCRRKHVSTCQLSSVFVPWYVSLSLMSELRVKWRMRKAFNFTSEQVRRESSRLPSAMGSSPRRLLMLFLFLSTSTDILGKIIFL